jgi:hypothetical protein
VNECRRLGRRCSCVAGSHSGHLPGQSKPNPQPPEVLCHIPSNTRYLSARRSDRFAARSLQHTRSTEHYIVVLLSNRSTLYTLQKYTAVVLSAAISYQQETALDRRTSDVHDFSTTQFPFTAIDCTAVYVLKHIERAGPSGVHIRSRATAIPQ